MILPSGRQGRAYVQLGDAKPIHVATVVAPGTVGPVRSSNVRTDAGATYRTVLWDLDHTLFDTDTSQLLGIRSVLEQHGVADLTGATDRFVEINEALWRRVESEGLSPNVVKIERFIQLASHPEIELDADPALLAEDYVVALGQHGELYTGAIDLLDAVSAVVASSALITNGIGAVQRARIERVGIDLHFEAVAISGELGCSKPGGEIFDRTFELLGTNTERAVIVGDSLTSDMRGGVDYGIDTIWFDREDLGTDTDWRAHGITHRATTFAEIERIVTATRP